MNISLQQSFLFGEAGDRLNGMPNTEVYSKSVKDCTNFIITNIGSLRVCNNYDEDTLQIDEDILYYHDTKFEFMFLVTQTKIYVMTKTSTGLELIPTSSISHGVTGVSVSNTFENYIVIGNGTTIKYFKYSTSGGLVATDFLATIKSPIRDRKPLSVGVYKWITLKEYNYETNLYEDKLQLFKIQTFQDMEAVGTNTDFNIIVEGIETIKRVYFLVNSYLVREDFDVADFADGDTFLNIESGDTADYYLNGKNVTFTDKVDDTKGNSWTTKISIKDIPYGTFTRGTAVSFNESTVKDTCVFQNRLSIITDEEIYFSEKFNYPNFLNGINFGDPFFFKPSPIRNKQPKLRKMIASRGLWVNTDSGYYNIGYNNQLAPSDYFENIASDRKPALEHIIIEDVLYYLDVTGILYAVYNIGEQIINFKSFEVDKFDISRDFISVSSLMVDGQEYVSVQRSAKPESIYLYRPLQDRMFSRFKMDTGDGTKFIGWYGNYFMGRGYYKMTSSFMKNAKITVQPPFVNLKGESIYSNQTKVNIKEVILKVLNEDREAITTVSINGSDIANVEVDDYFVYISCTSFQLKNGFDIEIEHAGNDKVCEILGIEIKYE